MRRHHLVLLPLILFMLSCDSSDSDGELTAVPDPILEGPVTGGRGSPFVQSTNFDLSEVGYRQHELFVSGTARAFTNVGTFDADGFWNAALSDITAPYKVRIVVYRPIDPQHFNGSVVVEWLNVSGGVDAAPDWTSTHTELTRERAMPGSACRRSASASKVAAARST